MKLSIIIPMYNVENYIEETIGSLINQTVKDFEIILIDDGSTDNTYKKSCNYLGNSQFKDYRIIKKSNGGVSSARNRGLSESNGDYVMFLDGDDYVSHNLVEEIINKNESREYDIICWGYNLVKENKSIITNYFDKFQTIPDLLSGIETINNKYNGNMKICTGSVAIKKQLLEDYGFNYTEGCVNGEDQEFTYKCLSRAKSVLFINKELTFYVQRRGSISNSYNIRRFDSVYAIRRTYDYLDSLNSHDLKLFSKALKTEFIINNFFGNLNNCLRYYKGINKIKGIKNLLGVIEQNYPGLIKDIQIKLKGYKGRNLKIYISKTFILSPIIYIYIFYIIDSIKNIKTKTNSV